ncbi:hypothetical protein L7F22_046004 [Adiantum nelumboides]|nr:hypothetical protein [Adiantum nelumboides]
MGSVVSSIGKSATDMGSPHGNVHVIQNRNEWDSKVFEATTSGKVVVVDFTATWCGPCKFIAPFFAELSEKYPNLVFLKVDVDDHSEISQEYEIRAMPTFLFIVDSKTTEKIVGANKTELEKKMF